MTEALRHNQGKPELSEVFWFDLEYLADHIQKGREKYPDVDGVPNFVLGGKPDKEYLDCISRHLKKIKQGDWADDEGFVHLAAIAWNALAALTLNHPYGGWEKADIQVRPEPEPEPEPDVHPRASFEGEDGVVKMFTDRGGTPVAVFYADTGRKVRMSQEQWQGALDQKVARWLEDD
jgi:hypothetical protein